MTTTSMTTAEVKEALSETINRVAHHKERVILTRRGKEVAAIVPIEDLMLLEASQNKSDLHDAIDALKEGRVSGMVNLEELEQELGDKR